MSSSASPFAVVVDTREQHPFAFQGITGARGRELEIVTCRAGLKTGDYSIKGYENRVSVERKCLNDIIGCLTVGRERFERELARSRELDYFALMIEATVKDIIHGNYWSKMLPKSAINSLLAFSIRYQLPIFFAGNRGYGNKLTEELLRLWLREQEKKT